MPLRDHFHRPSGRPNWDRVHGMWPAVIVQHLFAKLPSHYHVAPQVHMGPYFEIDVATFERDPDSPLVGTSGGTATATWAPPEPTLSLETEVPEQDEYAVNVYDADEGQRLVAAIEFVSPANKDRPESRRAFVAKCAALLQQDVCVSIVDFVTVRQFNLYADLLDLLGRSDPGMGTPAAHLYAVTVRRVTDTPRWRVQTWANVLQVGSPLPALPLWLNERDGVMVDLETTYEETCRTLRITD
jgi:hypothetical protein